MDNLIQTELSARNWSVADLARRLRGGGLHVSAETVRLWCAGRTMPSFRAACALSDLLGWDRNVMFKASGYLPD